jgi:hypothetical protein
VGKKLNVGTRNEVAFEPRKGFPAPPDLAFEVLALRFSEVRIYLLTVVFIDPATKNSAIDCVDGDSNAAVRAKPYPWADIHCIKRIKKYNFCFVK